MVRETAANGCSNICAIEGRLCGGLVFGFAEAEAEAEVEGFEEGALGVMAEERGGVSVVVEGVASSASETLESLLKLSCDRAVATFAIWWGEEEINEKRIHKD